MHVTAQVIHVQKVYHLKNIVKDQQLDHHIEEKHQKVHLVHLIEIVRDHIRDQKVILDHLTENHFDVEEDLLQIVENTKEIIVLKVFLVQLVVLLQKVRNRYRDPGLSLLVRLGILQKGWILRNQFRDIMEGDRKIKVLLIFRI